VRALEPAREVQRQPAVWESAAPAEARELGAGLVVVGRTRVARIRTVARAQAVARGWLEQAREAKRAGEVKRAKQVKQVKQGQEVKRAKQVKRGQAVHRATALCRCRFGSTGSMWKVGPPR
jgi:hypothetical protein